VRHHLLAIALCLLLASCGAETGDDPGGGNRSSSGGTPEATSFVFPLAGGLQRVTKKTFGLFVTPQSSPVQPERFTGYHTGIDFEILLGEEDQPVRVTAVCTGAVSFTGWVKGYGGVLITDCAVKDQPVTVLYGHLKESSVAVRKGASVQAGQDIAELGKGFSSETDGERKHLHLAVHRGSDINYKGYVQKKEDLQQWMDPGGLF